jgi:hypothetical protein
MVHAPKCTGTALTNKHPSFRDFVPEPFYIIGALSAKLHPSLYCNNNPRIL